MQGFAYLPKLIGFNDGCAQFKLKTLNTVSEEN